MVWAACEGRVARASAGMLRLGLLLTGVERAILLRPSCSSCAPHGEAGLGQGSLSPLLQPSSPLRLLLHPWKRWSSEND